MSDCFRNVMTATPAEVRLAFEGFRDDLDANGEAFDWSSADVKREFEQWLTRGEGLQFPWTDLHEHEVAVAMSRRYQPYLVSARRWFR